MQRKRRNGRRPAGRNERRWLTESRDISGMPNFDLDQCADRIAHLHSIHILEPTPFNYQGDFDVDKPRRCMDRS
jgi:hypothetical protein